MALLGEDVTWDSDTTLAGTGGAPLDLSCGSPACCTHPPCRKLGLSRRRWCHHWFWVQWALPNHLLLADFKVVLQACLGSLPYRTWGARRVQGGKCVFRFLLHVDSAGDGLAKPEVLRPWEQWPCSTGFFHDDCVVQPFRCCRLYFRREAAAWVASIPTFGSLVFGDGDLPSELCGQMRDVDRDMSDDKPPL